MWAVAAADKLQAKHTHVVVVVVVMMLIMMSAHSVLINALTAQWGKGVV